MPPRERPTAPEGGVSAGESGRQVVQVREFKGLNGVDQRTAIDDHEFSRLVNVVKLGRGTLKIVNGPGPTLYTAPGGKTILRWFGVVLAGTPVLLVFLSDGSGTQVDANTGATTSLGGAGTFTTTANHIGVEVWQGTVVLIADEDKGYLSWNGAALATVDAGTKCRTVAVFAGRAWLATGRTVVFTAANDYTTFVGGGSFTMTDGAFVGNITRLISAFEQLWIVGEGAVNALSNVQVVAGVVTFSNTNILSNLGTVFPIAVANMGRAISLVNGEGVYLLTGVSPQRISGKIDDLIGLGSTSAASAARATLESRPALLFTGASGTAFVYCENDWFTIEGLSIVQVGSVLNRAFNPANYQAFASTATRIFPLFTATTGTVWTVQSKLYDLGRMVQSKQSYRFLLEHSVLPTDATPCTVIFDGGDGAGLVTASGQIALRGSHRQETVAVSITGQYVGWTINGTTIPLFLSGWALDEEPGASWPS